MEGKSDALVSVLQERLLQSSMRHRSPTYGQRQTARRLGVNSQAGKIEDFSLENTLLPNMEESSRGGSRETFTPNIREIIDSIPKLNKMSF